MSSDSFARTSFPLVGAAADSTSESARAAGYAAGYAEGVRRARAELAEHETRLAREAEAARRCDADRVEQLIDVLNTALKSTLDAVVPEVRDVEDTLRRASCELAAAVVGCELDDADRAAASVVQRVLSHPEIDRALEIRLSAADAAVLDAETLKRIEAPVVVDESMRRGDGVVRFPDGYLDAHVSSALDRAARALEEGSGS